MLINFILVSCLAFSQQAVKNSNASQAQTTSKAKKIIDLVSYLKIEDSIKHRYQLAEDYLKRIPSRQDETAPMKKTVALTTLNYLKTQKDLFVKTGTQSVIKILNTSISDSDLDAMLKAFKADKNLEVEKQKSRHFQKINTLLKDPKFTYYIALPQKKMTEYYQFYLDDYRKKNGIPPGSFVKPRNGGAKK